MPHHVLVNKNFRQRAAMQQLVMPWVMGLTPGHVLAHDIPFDMSFTPLETSKQGMQGP